MSDVAFYLYPPDGPEIVIYEDGHFEGLPEGTKVVNALASNRAFERARALRVIENPYAPWEQMVVDE